MLTCMSCMSIATGTKSVGTVRLFVIFGRSASLLEGDAVCVSIEFTLLSNLLLKVVLGRFCAWCRDGLLHECENQV